MNINDSIRTLDPGSFYALVELIKGLDSPEIQSGIRSTIVLLTAGKMEIEKQQDILAKSNNSLTREVRMTTRRNTLKPLEEQMEEDRHLLPTLTGQNFVGLLYQMTAELHRAYVEVLGAAQQIKPGKLILSQKKHGTDLASYDNFQHMVAEFQLNQPTISRFIQAMARIADLRGAIFDSTHNIIRILEGYHRMLVDRHMTQGIKVHGDPVLTDVAMFIYENVDAHGEISAGKNADEISAYTVHKAEIMAETLADPIIHELIEKPEVFIAFLSDNLTNVWHTAGSLQQVFQRYIDDVKCILDLPAHQPRMLPSDLELRLEQIRDLNPKNINHTSTEKFLSREERFNVEFQNKTLAELVRRLKEPEIDAGRLISYILNRKAELRDFFRDENSFYVCKIGAGNPFLGDAPGALQVIPGPRPITTLDGIVGSGFDDVKKFIGHVESSAKWSDLFMAASPSKSTDKSNVLLIGPMGCGKTEVLRAVGGDKKSIGIFAQGSDFMTCWKGEAEKNPKRLFEAGLKLQKEARKHVHFLIDEIDAVLNTDKEFGGFNLTLEFQILMDGVVAYPNLSVWGATNNPERIPMPMMRRFSKVLIVGELSQADRVGLLKQYVSGYLPIDPRFTAKVWEDQALRLEGATGDVCRKIADHLWRSTMADFVEAKPTEATKLSNWLRRNGEFQVGEFADSERSEFKAELGKYTRVTPEALDNSVTLHLENIAIRHEIDTAKATYEKAHKLISQLKGGKS